MDNALRAVGNVLSANEGVHFRCRCIKNNCGMSVMHFVWQLFLAGKGASSEG